MDYTISLSLIISPAHWLVDRVFANYPGGLGSIPSRVIPKTLKMVLDTSLLNTQQYKVRIKGKVEQFKERSSALPTPQYSSSWKENLLVALDYNYDFLNLLSWRGAPEPNEETRYTYKYSIINQLIFNSMSNLYVKRLGNYTQCMFIFTFV